MQFYKEIKTSNPEHINNNVHHWLWSGQENKIALNVYVEKFLFSTYIHTSQTKKFKKSDRNLISDSAASVIRKLYEKGYANDRLAQDGLNCCQSIVFNLGYQDFVLDKETFKKLQGSDSIKNIMIIPGCQHPGMLKGRIKKAAKSIQYFNKNLLIVASGCNPLKNPTGPEKVTIPDESKFIINYLNDLLKKFDIETPLSFDKIEENKSFDTPSNIENTLNGLDKTQSHNLIIVSSTFQLIKLARAVEDKLTKFYNSHGNMDGFIKNIFLLGAEKEDAEFTPSKSSGYIKSMFVDVYNELLNYQSEEDRKKDVKTALEINGYCVLTGGGKYFVNVISQALGEIIQQKDILVEDNPKKWVTSKKEMPFHNDHSQADYIMWHCIEQTDSGGESLLTDCSFAFEKLDDAQKDLLKKVIVKNVKLFEKDSEYHPMVNVCDDGHEFYYVPWLIDDGVCNDTKNALNQLEINLKDNVVKILLKKDDVLVVNNKRLLHGRDAILGSSNRFLKRYWIRSKKR